MRQADPNAPEKPKRTPNAYQLFMANERLEMKKENIEMGPKDLMSEIGRRWKALEEAKKEPWKQQAERLKTNAAQDAEINAEKGLPRPAEAASSAPPAEQCPAPHQLLPSAAIRNHDEPSVCAKKIDVVL